MTNEALPVNPAVFKGAGGDPTGTAGPDYIAHRLKVWEAAVSARSDAATKSEAVPEVAITVTLPDGSQRSAIAGKTSPMDIALSISETLARKAMVAVVDDQQWDMSRPLVADCSLRICDFDTPEGKSVLWHSTAHMLGEAMEYKYKGELCIGPPLQDGFYYDIHLADDLKITESDFTDLNKRVDNIAKQKRKFERLELTKEEAKDMFSYNKFKLEIIDELEDDATITAYRDGPFIDLCRGPHVPQSSRAKAVMCKGTGQAYWRAKAENPSLQRVYGISFPDKKLMKEYKHLIEEAAKRDHRVIGVKQELVMFSQLSPGCPFFLPHGQRIFNTLQAFMRDQYWKRDYVEVQTPNMFDFELWVQSGHAANYKDNMYSLEVEGHEFGLKPMNCPSHCHIFKSRARSYRELPLRMADFGVLHRNELSGTLGGLTRVRRFQQDDAHIFCTEEQVKDEVAGILELLKYVYDIFGFTYALHLSTRPEKYLGDIALWDRAEQMLADALGSFTGKKCGEKDGWDLNPGDGAFYGPKIDIKLFDALRREHQCATLQLDFQLPIRFDLQYQAGSHPQSAPKSEGVKQATPKPASQPEKKVEVKKENADSCCGGNSEQAPECAKNVPAVKEGFARPVILHRAIFGSLERFIAILIEHYGGYWPFWLSPRQCIVVPVSEKFLKYAKDVQKELKVGYFYVDVDTTDRTLGKKLAEARNYYYNTILVVGEQEVNSKTVNLRIRGVEKKEELSVSQIRQRFEDWRREFK
ncbi:putative threonine--tRNA ligase 1, cytoplasmic [Gracilariopsis chorda]|uniref:threonine--tRNA ligase n=1 Tax=Gracilariopsis chorda TaxID=448386 RepID=A0A2V3IZC7_9FLOR|nr:putative threonine--tRNA ligase 1, cytoplasmic [Gracilariopsis chorda]|eukprot:PXF47498.1 putative threonine--tRNA ligase 1, cytoplasmic [Gracilariopsis chorda]